MPRNNGKASFISLPRSKPFKYTFEKEIVMYAFYKKLVYFSTECTYSPGAYRGHARIFLKELERINPKVILDIIKSGECFEDQQCEGIVSPCVKCSHPTSSSNAVCKGCELIAGLRALSRGA
jgi:cytoplasmic tRNA 2-thiolation protein 1